MELGLRVAMFDTQLMKFINFDVGRFLQVTYGEDHVRIKANNPDDRIVVVIHENPDLFKFDRVRVDGLARVIGHLVFETEGLPTNWPKFMVSLDEFWAASEFNRRTFEGAGIPSFMIAKIPHSLDTGLYGKDIGHIRFVNDSMIEFLTVCTNMQRRDLSLAIRSFYRAFSNDDSARFVIKLAGEAAKPNSVSLIRSMIEETALPYASIDSCLANRVMLITQNYSDEDMIRLYQGCDVYLSIERANGWDLPSMEAMACGKPCIGYYVGGSTEYRDTSVSLCLPVMDETIPIPTIDYHPLYTGQVWPVVNEAELVDAMVKVKDAELRATLGKAAKAHIARWFDIRVVAENIRSLVSTYDATDYRSNHPAQITIGENSTWRTSSVNPQAIDDLFASLLCHPSKGLSATRNFIRSLPREDLAGLNRGGGVNPDSVTRALSKMLSISWRRPLKKIKAIYAAKRLSRRRLQTLENEVSQGLIGIYATDYSAARRITDNDIEARKRISVLYPTIQTFVSDRKALRSRHNRYQGERCFIIGNGPSLNDLDLSKLAKEYTFGMNKIYLLYDRIDWRPSFYTLLDWRVGPSVIPHITELADSVKFLPYRFRGLFPKDNSTYWFTTRPVFDDIDDQIFPRHSKRHP